MTFLSKILSFFRIRKTHLFINLAQLQKSQLVVVNMMTNLFNLIETVLILQIIEETLAVVEQPIPKHPYLDLNNKARDKTYKVVDRL